MWLVYQPENATTALLLNCFSPQSHVMAQICRCGHCYLCSHGTAYKTVSTCALFGPSDEPGLPVLPPLARVQKAPHAGAGGPSFLTFNQIFWPFLCDRCVSRCCCGLRWQEQPLWCWTELGPGWQVFSRFIVLENHPVYSCALHPDCCKLLNFGLWVSVKYLFKYQFINWYWLLTHRK